MFAGKISLSVEPGQMAIDPPLSVIPIPPETGSGSRIPLTQTQDGGSALRYSGTGKTCLHMRKSFISAMWSEWSPSPQKPQALLPWIAKLWNHGQSKKSSNLPSLLCDLRCCETQLFLL